MDATGRSAIVVGGGVFGAAGALELASRGWGVRLLDPGPLPHPDAASTDVSKIVRMDYGADGFYADLAAAALEAWRRWNAEWGVPLYHEDGFLVLTGEDGGGGSFESDSWETLSARGVPLERLDPDRIRRRFPEWNAERFPGGYYNRRAGWAESGRAVARILEAARDAGASLETGLRVSEVHESAARVAGVRTDDGGDHPADLVVVAAGAWTPSLLPRLGDVMWATGQPVLHFRVEDPGRWQAPAFPPWAADIANTGWYGFPALDDGILKVGHHGTGRRADPDGALVVEPEHEARCRRFLRDALPALADAPLTRSRLCLYCDTFDSDFWIDRDPDLEGLVVAAGGSGHGFKFAPVLGEIIADVAEAKEHRWARRFRWRPPGEARVEPARAADG